MRKLKERIEQADIKIAKEIKFARNNYYSDL
jgi:hypothetical protein